MPHARCWQQSIFDMHVSPLVSCTWPVAEGNLLSGDYDGRTALHLATAEGQVEAVRMLLDRGASVDVVDRWGSTPLLEALMLGSRPIAELLIERGASVKRNTFSLVKFAAETDTALLQLACMKAGADPHSCDYDRRSVLHSLCAAGDFKAVEALLSLGIDVNGTDRSAPLPAGHTCVSTVGLKLLVVGESAYFAGGIAPRYKTRSTLAASSSLPS